jgi:hypothetical protein
VSLRARGQGWEQGGKGLVDVVHRRAVERCSRALMPIFVSFLDPAGVLVGANSSVFLLADVINSATSPPTVSTTLTMAMVATNEVTDIEDLKEGE